LALCESWGFISSIAPDMAAKRAARMGREGLEGGREGLWQTRACQEGSGGTMREKRMAGEGAGQNLGGHKGGGGWTREEAVRVEEHLRVGSESEEEWEEQLWGESWRKECTR
jgi:hypothetical protein